MAIKGPRAKTGKTISKLSPTARTRTRSTKSKISRPEPKQVKTRPGIHSAPIIGKSGNKKKKQRVYTDSELGLPALNMITPANAAAQPKGSGKKKNKIYVDDKEGMMTIMALVNAEKEGQIESKMMKMRQMEEIREARRLEAEKREQERAEKFEGVKKGLRRKRGKGEKGGDDATAEVESRTKSGKKRVSFA